MLSAENAPNMFAHSVPVCVCRVYVCCVHRALTQQSEPNKNWLQLNIHKETSYVNVDCGG